MPGCSDAALLVECSNGLWIGIEITIATSVDGRSIDILMQCLVDEVPVETALKLGQSSCSSGCRGIGSADKIPVVLKVATGVSHGVVVFALDEWLGERRVVSVFGAVLDTEVHWTENVGGVAALSGLLILDWTAGVLGVYPVVGIVEILRVFGFVTQTPYYHAGVVIVQGDVMLVALHNLLCEEWGSGDGILAISESMTFLVGLSNEVEAVLVAEVVPARIIGIMACAYGVDIEALHNFNVLNHTLEGYVVTTVGVHFVAVGALDEYWLSVDKQLGFLISTLRNPTLHGNGLVDGHTIVAAIAVA